MSGERQRELFLEYRSMHASANDKRLNLDSHQQRACDVPGPEMQILHKLGTRFKFPHDIAPYRHTHDTMSGVAEELNPRPDCSCNCCG